ncbi:MAG: DUF3570 domain-containing protein [Bacteroidetes bacterium]|nr:DUF3570 domain-containing protein [Bacteroidota bacterium]
MKEFLSVLFIFSCLFGNAQDTTAVYKKRVLESTEVDFLASYYSQDGNNASVTGGIGTEELTDVTPTITISMPLNADDVLTIDAGISAYTSASSSNVDPFDASGASGGVGEGDNLSGNINPANNVEGSPWVASSGASAMDVWGNTTITYSHSSDDRNKIWSANASVSAEYDYFSIGFGGAYSYLFNQKNTEIGIRGNVFLDTWSPKYPTELDSYLQANGDLTSGFFQGITIWDQNGIATDPIGTNPWSPVQGFDLIKDKGRNTFSLSLSFSQILSKNAQLSIFSDLVYQQGWLANPMQRVYFGDRENYYIGNPDSIANYTSSSNTNVFQLADDFERLPDTRIKTPIGARLNYFVNENISVRTYYRYYFDDWGMTSHTVSLEVPVKLGTKFTLYPSYRYYTQTAIDYFAPYEENLSTQEFYTSDYDLSAFDAHQYGFGIRYTDIFTKFKLFDFGLKSIDIRYQQYDRSTGLNAGIITGGFKFVLD